MVGSRYESHQQYPTVRQSIPEHFNKTNEGIISQESDAQVRTIQVVDFPDQSHSLEQLDSNNPVNPSGHIPSTKTSPKGAILKDPVLFNNAAKRNSMTLVRDSGYMSMNSNRSNTVN